jgi:hypothetical protein
MEIVHFSHNNKKTQKEKGTHTSSYILIKRATAALRHIISLNVFVGVARKQPKNFPF